ncbi:U6 snRNA-associated Sm-like protein LSm7 [Schizopora paradoxa]|uniref:U6 snRNA-associated Sm-like protein LSm7 n=1 Tax=Schizopora paradoxa TaxID=27342 RepID=A0A0H2S1L4_9AGAM|nr:U6 snRNA-associated Sm-like protein LSm7 [Schizopora paradoxa]
MADRGRGFAKGAPRGGAMVRGKSQGAPASSAQDKPKREAILDLSKYMNEYIRVKFTGGREVKGKLKGYDQLLNLVLDDVEEDVQGKYAFQPEPHTRNLGLVVLRGPTITLLNPVDGFEEIENPFAEQQ